MNCKTISDIFDKRNNSFTMIGFISSLLVIYFHCYPLYYGTSIAKSDLISMTILKGTTLGAFVVQMFFITSGFLITFSLEKSKNSWEYIFKRIKRIIPSLFFVLLITIWFIVPLVSSLKWSEIIFSPSVYYHYIFDNITFVKNTVYLIGDSFVSNPYPNVINGSIWTLKHQFILYMMVLVIYKIGILKNKKSALLFWLISFFAYLSSLFGVWNNIIIYMQTNLHKVGILNEFGEFLRLQYYFFSGVLLNVFKDDIKVSKVHTLFMLMLYIMITYIFKRIDIALIITMPYLIVILCCWKKLNMKIDLSYEIYIVAFPIQQCIMYFWGNKISMIIFIILSIIFSIIVAYFLKYLVTMFFSAIDRKISKNQLIV